jgi:hypothetical protein
MSKEYEPSKAIITNCGFLPDGVTVGVGCCTGGGVTLAGVCIGSSWIGFFPHADDKKATAKHIAKIVYFLLNVFTLKSCQ